MSKGKARVNYLGREGLVQHETQPDYDFLYVASTTKNPKWDVGDRVVLPDGRVFRYALAKAAVYTTKGAKAWDEEIVKYATLQAGSAIGAKSISVTVAGTDGSLGGGNIAKDELRGGQVCIYDGAGDVIRQHRGIIGNSVVTGGGTITIYLDGALAVVVTTTNDVEVLGNIYRNTFWGNETYSSVLGIPMRNATAAQYYWMQTWGPICISPGDAGSGGVAEERQLVFGANGGVFCHNAAHATTKQQQHAGFIIQKDSAGGDGPPFVMLQISP